MPLLPSPGPCWELQLFDGVRNGPLLVGANCTPARALELTAMFEKWVAEYKYWQDYGGSIGAYEMDEIYLAARSYAGADFEILGEVSFILVSKDLGQVWHVSEGVFSKEETPA